MPWTNTQKPPPRADEREAGEKRVGPWGDKAGRDALFPPAQAEDRAKAPPPLSSRSASESERTQTPLFSFHVRTEGGSAPQSVGREWRLHIRLTDVAKAVAVAVLLVWGLSGFYVVGADQEAVVTRFGAPVRQTGPGLHYRLPAPLEQAQRLETGRTHLLEVRGPQASAPTLTGLITTADSALVGLDYAVAWRIRDPQAYLFHVADPEESLRRAAAEALRRQVSRRSLSQLLAGGADRGALEAQAAADIQQSINRAGAGVLILGVEVRAIVPPAQTHAAALDKIAAVQEAKAREDEANAYRAQTLAAAQLAATKTVADARAYRDQAITEAKGAAARFDAVEAAYRKAPAITKDRLYFETLQGVMAHAHVVVVDTPKGSGVALPPEILRAPPAPAPRSGAP